MESEPASAITLTTADLRVIANVISKVMKEYVSARLEPEMQSVAQRLADMDARLRQLERRDAP
jgi:hypothetical protein